MFKYLDWEGLFEELIGRRRFFLWWCQLYFLGSKKELYKPTIFKINTGKANLIYCSPIPNLLARIVLLITSEIIIKQLKLLS
jgi:hypothetical protein